MIIQPRRTVLRDQTWGRGWEAVCIDAWGTCLLRDKIGHGQFGGKVNNTAQPNDIAAMSIVRADNEHTWEIWLVRFHVSSHRSMLWICAFGHFFILCEWMSVTVVNDAYDLLASSSSVEREISVSRKGFPALSTVIKYQIEKRWRKIVDGRSS